VLKDIRRQTRRKYSAEERIRIVLEGLRGEENISELCRREGVAASMYHGWSKEFLEAVSAGRGWRLFAARFRPRRTGTAPCSAYTRE
jgi:transposase-like protein